ncbi:MAG: hypothetical protein IT338_14070 [Thermomicrobiales bacterium]|nr:hypothetical protein [Thermomicrobiales bacterium]
MGRFSSRPADRSGLYLLALDAGIGGGRCLIFDTHGTLVARAYEEWAADRVPGVPGGFSFDPERYWTALTTAARAALDQGAIPAEQVAAISVTCQREGFVLLDDAGQVLYAGPSADMRGREYNAALAEQYGAELYPITGHLPGAIHVPGRLLWLKEHEPATFAAAARLMMINDWMVYRLSGAWVGEPSNACSSVLFDIRSGNWSDLAIARAGLRRDVFPPIVPSGTAVGELLPAAAEETGLLPGTPVVVGGGDAQCGMLGAGAIDTGAVAAIAGTTTPILMNLDRPLIDEKRRTWTRSGLQQDRWALEANAGITGLALRWLRDLLYENPSEDTFPHMIRLADDVPPGSHGALSFLGPTSLRRRGLTDLGSGRLIGIGPFGGGRPEVIRATMESICYAVRANVELLAEVSRRDIPEVRLVGGQSRSVSWTQMQADILGIPVALPPVSEASAWGAAICAGVGIGLWSTVAEAVQSSSASGLARVSPRPEETERYAASYDAWLRESDPQQGEQRVEHAL